MSIEIHNNPNYKTIIGDNIKKIRKSQKLSQEELASLMKIKREYISYAENGKMDMQIGKIFQFAKALGVSHSDIWKGVQTIEEIIDKEPEQQTIGEKIRDLRFKKGLSQPKLAKIMGCKRQYISAVETDKENLKKITIQKFADALGVSPSEIWKGVQVIEEIVDEKPIKDKPKLYASSNIKHVRYFFNDLLNIIGKNVIKKEKEMGMTTTETAEIMGATPQGLYPIEKGKVGLSYHKLLRIAQALNINPLELLKNTYSIQYASEDLHNYQSNKIINIKYSIEESPLIIGNNLKRIMKKKRCRTTDLALTMRKKPQYISKLKAGKDKQYLKTLYQIAQGLRIDIVDLLKGTYEIEYEQPKILDKEPSLESNAVEVPFKIVKFKIYDLS